MATTRTAVIIGALALAACGDGAAIERLEQEKAALVQERAELQKKIDAAKATLEDRPARAPTFKARAEKLIEIFAKCEEPCAAILQKKSDAILDEARHAELRTTIGACVARCM
jgi:hypothetical protein